MKEALARVLGVSEEREEADAEMATAQEDHHAAKERWTKEPPGKAGGESEDDVLAPCTDSMLERNSTRVPSSSSGIQSKAEKEGQEGAQHHPVGEKTNDEESEASYDAEEFEDEEPNHVDHPEHGGAESVTGQEMWLEKAEDDDISYAQEFEAEEELSGGETAVSKVVGGGIPPAEKEEDGAAKAGEDSVLSYTHDFDAEATDPAEKPESKVEGKAGQTMQVAANAAGVNAAAGEDDASYEQEFDVEEPDQADESSYQEDFVSDGEEEAVDCAEERDDHPKVVANTALTRESQHEAQQGPPPSKVKQHVVAVEDEEVKALLLEEDHITAAAESDEQQPTTTTSLDPQVAKTPKKVPDQNSPAVAAPCPAALSQGHDEERATPPLTEFGNKQVASISTPSTGAPSATPDSSASANSSCAEEEQQP